MLTVQYFVPKTTCQFYEKDRPKKKWPSFLPLFADIPKFSLFPPTSKFLINKCSKCDEAKLYAFYWCSNALSMSAWLAHWMLKGLTSYIFDYISSQRAFTKVWPLSSAPKARLFRWPQGLLKMLRCTDEEKRKTSMTEFNFNGAMLYIQFINIKRNSEDKWNKTEK